MAAHSNGAKITATNQETISAMAFPIPEAATTGSISLRAAAETIATGTHVAAKRIAARVREGVVT